MPEIGEYVLYGGNGICRITDLVMRTVCGKTREYYTLTPVYDKNSSVFVPADNPRLLEKMKTPVSRDGIIDLIKQMPRVSYGWLSDTEMRSDKYEAVLESGDRLSLLKMIECIYEKQTELLEQRKKLSTIDKNAVKRAEKIIYEEFAVVLDLPPEQIPDFIRTVLATVKQ